MRHFDAHAYRTEDADGVWDFARGCMRTYLILREKAERFHADAEIQEALEAAKVDRLAEPALATVTPDAIAGLRARPARCRRAGEPGLRQRAARPARDRAAARRPLTHRRAAGARRRLVDAVDEGRGPRRRLRRARRARPRAAPADQPAAQRAGPGRVVGRARRRDRRRRHAAREVAAVVGRGPAARPGGARRRRARSSGPPSSGTTPSRRPTPAGWSAGSAVPRTWAEACGSVPVAAFTITKLSWLASQRARRVRRASARVLPAARLAHLEADRRVRHRSRRRVGHRLLLGGRGRVPARPARDRRRIGRLGRAVCPRVLGPLDRAGATGAFGMDAAVAAGTGDNMAAALGARADAGRRRGLARARREPSTPSATRPLQRRRRRGRGVRRRDRSLPAARVHAERDEGDRRGRAAARRRPRRVSTSWRSTRRRERAAWCSCRTSTVSARPTARRVGIGPGLRSGTSREQLARAAVEGVVCGLLDGLDALAGAGVRADGNIVLVGGGARSARVSTGPRRSVGSSGRRPRRGRARRGGRVHAGRRGPARSRSRRGRGSLGSAARHRRRTRCDRRPRGGARRLRRRRLGATVTGHRRGNTLGAVGSVHGERAGGFA